MKTKIMLLVSVLIVIAFSSCKKENDDLITPVTPVVKVTSSSGTPQSQIVLAGMDYTEVFKFKVKVTGTSLKLSAVPVLFSSSNWTVTGFVEDIKCKILGKDFDVNPIAISSGSESVIVLNFPSNILIEDGETVEVGVYIHTKRLAHAEDESFPEGVAIRASINSSQVKDMFLTDMQTGELFVGERLGSAIGNNIIFE